jgi:hypothetical protein
MGVSEDELANAIVEAHLAAVRETNDGEAGVYPEAHYNHYGTRGVADLYLTGGGRGTLLELKSESAIRRATGANEVIRQFNRMCGYFFRGSDYRAPERKLTFELCFTAGESNLRHLVENAALYAALPGREFAFEDSAVDVDTRVTFRHTDHPTPVSVFSETVDVREGVIGAPSASFAAYVASANPVLFADLGESIRAVAGG